MGSGDGTLLETRQHRPCNSVQQRTNLVSKAHKEVIIFFFSFVKNLKRKRQEQRSEEPPFIPPQSFTLFHKNINIWDKRPLNFWPLLFVWAIELVRLAFGFSTKFFLFWNFLLNYFLLNFFTWKMCFPMLNK